MKYKNLKKTFQQSADLILESSKLFEQIIKVVDVIVKSYQEGNKVVIFGNGGSAADSQHFAAELVGRYKFDRKSLPAIALSTDTSVITAIGNDYGFENIFARQCSSIVNKNDVVIAISTSGKSQNILNGVIAAKKKGCLVVGLTGNDGGELKRIVDIPIIVSSKSTPRIQEVHRVVIHIICDAVEQHFKTKT